jgi:hypothetical protein
MPWPDVKGKRCLDVWTFDESLRFEMAGYRVTNLAGDPGYRGASKGAGFGLALRDSVVHPTSAFASRHRQPGSADTFGSAVVTEDDVRRYSLMQGYEYIARRRSFVEFNTGVRSRRFLGWNVAPRTWRYVPTATSSPLRPQRVRRSSSSSSI